MAAPRVCLRLKTKAAPVVSACRVPLRQACVRRRGSSVICCAQANVSEVRKLLAIKGWDRAWIDGITERVQKKQITASIEDLGAVVDTLDDIGLKGAQIEHVCTIAWNVLNRSPDDIRAVADHIARRGAANPALLLFKNPKLLEYEAVPGREELVRGERGRAKVAVLRRDGNEEVLVSFYSPNAVFKTAPISPWEPESVTSSK